MPIAEVQQSHHWTIQKLSVDETRLAEVDARLAGLKAKHHAAALIVGDRRARTLREIGEQISKAIKHKSKLERSRDECRQRLHFLSPRWQDLHDEFQVLRKEEVSSDPGNRQDRWLRAYTRTDNIKEWELSQGISEGFRARLELLATRAGAALDLSQGATKQNLWLYHLYLDLEMNQSRLRSASSGKPGGIVLGVIEASAIYCARLAQEALENSVSTTKRRARKLYKAIPKKKESAKKAFSVSDDNRSVILDDKQYTLTRAQSQMFGVLYKGYQSGHPDVDKDSLLKAIGNETSRVQDTWRHSPLWNTLVGSGRKGTYRLRPEKQPPRR